MGNGVHPCTMLAVMSWRKWEPFRSHHPLCASCVCVSRPYYNLTTTNRPPHLADRKDCVYSSHVLRMLFGATANGWFPLPRTAELIESKHQTVTHAHMLTQCTHCIMHTRARRQRRMRCANQLRIARDRDVSVIRTSCQLAKWEIHLLLVAVAAATATVVAQYLRTRQSIQSHTYTPTPFDVSPPPFNRISRAITA